MENMENNVVTTENAAAEAATRATFGQKVLGGFVGACAIVGVVTVVKKAVSIGKTFVGKLFKPKASEQTEGTIEAPDSVDETK